MATQLDDQTAAAVQQYRSTETLRARPLTDYTRDRLARFENLLHQEVAALTPAQFDAYAQATVAWDAERNAADKAANS